MPDPGVLDGRTVLVTGAGRGIGRAIALGIAAAGAQVCLAARSHDQLEDVAARITAVGGAAVTCAGDVTLPADARRMVATAVRAFGALDGLVNNAGIIRSASIASMAVEDWDAVMTTNLRGMFLCTQAAVRPMTEAGRGKIVNIASSFGVTPVKAHAAYCASKAAILHFTRVAALEFAKLDVQVNAVAPGYVSTDLNAESLADDGVRDRILRRIPAGRIAQPDDLKATVRYLLSSESDYVTGQTVVIDGGFSLT
jgi:NAD(P)-dependent dehydrogenase (short-subunit alcohol dehydrogenase family)